MAKKDEVKEELKALVPAAGTALSTINYDDAAEFAPVFTADEVALPFLRVVQKNSPYVDSGHALYIEAARPGMIINTLTKELVQSLGVIPVTHESQFIEWVPRDKGGGIVNVYTVSEGEKALKTTKKGGERGTKDVLPNGNELVRYIRYVALAQFGGVYVPIVISMKSTELKKGKAWNALIGNLKTPNGRPMPHFGGAYSFKTVREEKNGESWFNWEITAAGITAPAEFNLGMELARAVRAGNVKIADDTTDDMADGGHDNQTELDKEVPF